MNARRRCALVSVSVLTVAAASGCATRPPTIAHVHIGHAVTGVHVTPDQRGYFVEAEARAVEALERAREAGATQDLRVAQQSVAAAVRATIDPENFGLRHSLLMAVNHLSFAATSADASQNLQAWAPRFSDDAKAVIARCDLIALLGDDMRASTTMAEASVLVQEILRLTDANLNGDDADGDGRPGAATAEFGVRQLRARLDALIAGENPPYSTVDRWYLFNLVRLPNGRWVFDKFGRGGNIEGYK